MSLPLQWSRISGSTTFAANISLGWKRESGKLVYCCDTAIITIGKSFMVRPWMKNEAILCKAKCSEIIKNMALLHNGVARFSKGL
jgi:hypothetical protein